jgi:alpha-1,6-mannosyltransferase
VNVRSGIESWHVGRAWLTNAVLCALGTGLMVMARQFVAEHFRYRIGYSGVSGWSDVLFVAAVVIVLTQPVNRATLWIVLGFAVAMRGKVLFTRPYLSTDIYRYVWDGIVQHAHISPYRYAPGDPALAVLQVKYPGIFQHINRRDYAHTIYPPVAQMIYWLVTLFSPTAQAMKLAMFGFECVTAGALIALLRRMGRRTTDVLLYAWCPLLVWEIGSAGHIDAAILAFVALALLFRYREQPVITGLFLGMAVMTKFYPLILLPALWRRGDWKMPATLVGVCAAGYAAYASAGKLVFGFLGGYAKEEGIDSGTRYFLLDYAQGLPGLHWLTKTSYLVFCALVFGVIVMWAWRYASNERLGVSARVQHPAFVRASMMLALALMVLFSPHYPWYIAWLIPLMTVFPNFVTLTYVCAFFYGFTTQWAMPGPKMFLLNSWIYFAVLCAFVVEIMWQQGGLGRWFDWRGTGRVA